MDPLGPSTNRLAWPLARWLVLLLPGLALAGWLSGCLGPAQGLPQLRIGHAPHDHHAPLYIAAMNPEHFRRHGGVWLEEQEFRKHYRLMIDNQPRALIEIEVNTGGDNLIRRLAEDHYDLSFGGIPPMLSAIDQDRPIRILSPVMAEGSGLVVRKDLPANNWAEFLALLRQHDTAKQPLRIGYRGGKSVQNMIFLTALRHSQISPGFSLGQGDASLILLDMQSAKNLPPALEKGLIDGYLVSQPWLAMAEIKGDAKVIARMQELPPDGHWQGHPCCALAASNSFSQSQPELAEALIGLFRRANQRIREQPEQAAEQVARWLNLPVEVERRSLADIDFDVQLDQRWHQGMAHWLKALQQQGEFKGRLQHSSAEQLPGQIYRLDLYQHAQEARP
ncbi:MAG: ABC transporter substrate-binding protein [Gammaproteobacteria bacterium]|nr:ABC transporter substrate-binding protein [Gammaproteobacteria bacterium]